MDHSQNIEYDVNFLIQDEDIFTLFHRLSDFSWICLTKSYYDAIKAYSLEEFNAHIFHELQIWWEAMHLSFSRKDIGQFQIIIRKFDTQRTCIRYALNFDSKFTSNELINLVVGSLLYDFCTTISPVCMTAGEIVVPYFIDEIKKSQLEWDFLYLDSSFIDEGKLLELPKDEWLFYGKGVIFLLIKNSNLLICKSLKD